jgi:protein-S-isoprenylcysteine O-methyltransferase Ste14
MIRITALILTLLLFLMVITVVIRSVIRMQSIIGRPPVPVFYFVLAKMLVVVNLTFLLLRGLDISNYMIFKPALSLELVALALLILGVVILLLATFQLNNDLIFGLSTSRKHTLHTRGIFSISRHPFYLGFIFILFSSCLFYPNLLNIAAFTGAWIIHHFIMMKEEEFLTSQYGDEYRQYMKDVKRYITF